MKDSLLRSKSKEFAVKLFEMCDNVNTKKGRGVLVNQIIRSGTSVGANIYEANYASSKADFANKLQIALKECYETEYWLDMMQSTGCISKEAAEEMLRESGVIRRMLVKSLNTLKTQQ